ncbi:hypothetical protein DIC82_05665 [Clostridium beijerinckii]|nr:hypothetical protein DIC82_05665 [Clostridium beijerinckii]
MRNPKYFKNYINNQYEEYCDGIFRHGEQVNARYIEQTEPTFQGNELIEALPPERDVEKCFEGLYRPPVFSTIERGESKTYRINAIFRLMNYITPVLKNFEIDKLLSIVIRHGYVSKRIKSPEYIKELKKHSDLLNSEYMKMKNSLNCICDSSLSSSSGFSLFGISGAGKTTAINNSLNYYPQVIKHTGNEEDRFLFTQVTWIKIDCSYNGGLKGVCQKFFEELDKLLDTDYLRKHGNTRNGVERMIIAMAHLSLQHGLGIFVIDEIQHLCGNINGEHLLNYFVTMMNEIKLPVVYIGTYKAYKTILAKDFRHARRATGISNIRWDRLVNNEEWDMFITDLWKYQWTSKESILTQEIKNIMYEKTGGITDRIIKLFMAVQVNAIETGKEIITPNIIKKVAKENFALTVDMIEALENGNLKKLAMYDDLYSPDISKMIETAKQTKLQEEVKAIYDNNIKSKKDTELQIRNNIEIALCKFGYDSKEIRKSLDVVIKAYGIKKDESFLLKQTCKILITDEDMSIKNKPTVKSKTKEITKEEHDNFLEENIKKDFLI